jgi:hypothetical protein
MADMCSSLDPALYTAQLFEYLGPDTSQPPVAPPAQNSARISILDEHELPGTIKRFSISFIRRALFTSQ